AGEKVGSCSLRGSSQLVTRTDRQGRDIVSIRRIETAGGNGAIRKEGDLSLRQMRQFGGNFIVEYIGRSEHAERFSEKQDRLLDNQVECAVQFDHGMPRFPRQSVPTQHEETRVPFGGEAKRLAVFVENGTFISRQLRSVMVG